MRRNRDIGEVILNRDKTDSAGQRSHGVGWTGLSPADRTDNDGSAQLGVGWTGQQAAPQNGMGNLTIRALWRYNLLDPESLPTLGLEHLLVQRGE